MNFLPTFNTLVIESDNVLILQDVYREGANRYSLRFEKSGGGKWGVSTNPNEWDPTFSKLTNILQQYGMAVKRQASLKDRIISNQDKGSYEKNVMTIIFEQLVCVPPSLPPVAAALQPTISPTAAQPQPKAAVTDVQPPVAATPAATLKPTISPTAVQPTVTLTAVQLPPQLPLRASQPQSKVFDLVEIHRQLQAAAEKFSAAHPNSFLASLSYAPECRAEAEVEAAMKELLKGTESQKAKELRDWFLWIYYEVSQHCQDKKKKESILANTVYLLPLCKGKSNLKAFKDTLVKLVNQ